MSGKRPAKPAPATEYVRARGRRLALGAALHALVVIGGSGASFLFPFAIGLASLSFVYFAADYVLESRRFREVRLAATWTLAAVVLFAALSAGGAAIVTGFGPRGPEL